MQQDHPRIQGDARAERVELLRHVDVVVGYTVARHRRSLAGWRLEAALSEQRMGFRGGETVVLRARPDGHRGVLDLPPVPPAVLEELAERLRPRPGIAALVPDLASAAPDVDGRAPAPGTHPLGEEPGGYESRSA